VDCSPHDDPIRRYQKQLRIQEALQLMLNEYLDAGSAGGRVGYESASQFSREDSRLFGAPPQRDVTRLRVAPGTGAGQPTSNGREVRGSRNRSSPSFEPAVAAVSVMRRTLAMTFKVSGPSAEHLRGLWSELGAVLTCLVD
jgi:AraC-like DNA-binding protein